MGLGRARPPQGACVSCAEAHCSHCGIGGNGAPYVWCFDLDLDSASATALSHPWNGATSEVLKHRHCSPSTGDFSVNPGYASLALNLTMSPGPILIPLPSSRLLVLC